MYPPAVKNNNPKTWHYVLAHSGIISVEANQKSARNCRRKDEHPEERTTRITEDYLCRHKLSIENILKLIRKVNELDGEIIPCGKGYFIGYKTHGDKTIGLVLVPWITKDIYGQYLDDYSLVDCWVSGTIVNNITSKFLRDNDYRESFSKRENFSLNLTMTFFRLNWNC